MLSALSSSSLRTTARKKLKKDSYTSNYTPYDKFFHSIHSDSTKIMYSFCLKRFLKFCKFTKYEQLLQISNKKKEEAIRDHIMYLLHHEKLSYSSINNTAAAIKHFYVLNGVRLLLWDELKSLKGKKKSVIVDRKYTPEELKTLIEYADLREKVAILTMLSSGIRVGALADLRIGDLTYNEEYKLYRIVAYSQDTAESYVTYCTPECANYINLYLEDRKKGGETITPDSPLITHKINSKSMNKESKGFMGSQSIEKLLDRERHDAKVISRTTMKELKKRVAAEEQKGKGSGGKGKTKGQLIRKEVMRTHGFRKIFDTACVDYGVNPVIKEVLMGHKTKLGLDTSYYRPGDENQLMQEYLKVIDALTIDDTYRLRRKTEKLEKEVEEINLLKRQLMELEKDKKEYEEKTKKEIDALWELNEKREIDIYKEAVEFATKPISYEKYKEREKRKLERRKINFLPENRRWKKIKK